MSTSVPYHRGDIPQTTLASARVMLERMPASQISMRELARESQVSHAAPYKHFGDRHGFLVALAARCMTEFLHAQQDAMRPASPGEALLAVGEAYVRYGVDHPHAFALIFDTEISPPNHPPAALEPLIASHAALLRSVVIDTRRAGKLPAAVDPATLGAALWSQAHGLTQLVIAGRIPASQVSATLGALLGDPSGGGVSERSSAP